MDTVTLSGVELLRVGRWRAAAGDGNISAEDLDAMVAAAADPEVDAAPVRIGHDDPRFDGQPALGWLTNVRREGDRLLADIVGVPQRLAPRFRDAWRRRSIEAVSNLRTPSGRLYRRALTGLALLGIAAPAVKGLADVLALYGAAAGPRPDLVILTQPTETPMDAAELRTMLGLPADATDEQVRTRLTELAPPPLPAGTVPPPPPARRDDVVLVDRAALTELQERIGRVAREEADSILDQAIRDGRIPPARRQHYARLMEADPEGTRVLLTADPEDGGLAKNTLPVTELGYGPEGDDDFGYRMILAARGLSEER